MIKAVIFDFIGTLTSLKRYSLDKSKLKLHMSLSEAGFNTEKEEFLNAYDRAYEKYRIVRYDKLVEVTDVVWIADALNSLGFDITPDDARLKTAVDVFYEDYLNALKLNPCSRRLLSRLSGKYKIGLISNFTYARVIHAALERLDLKRFISVVLVSQDAGWRKPNQKIFQEGLRRLRVKGEETLFVGDSPIEDIGGASAASMKTVFLPSQFYTLKDLHESHRTPDMVVRNMCELLRIFRKIAENLQNEA
jgi:HAD superfamily hydrolase (TIGR01509 family)